LVWASWRRAVEALGAQHAIDNRSEDVVARVVEITGGRGVDLILDRIGGKGFGRNFEMLAPLVMVNSIGVAGADRRVLMTAPAGRRARAPTRTGRINRYLRGGAECAVWS
jgi:NADPH:quinone reductase-like Zn-dependent oxidoreductase